MNPEIEEQMDVLFTYILDDMYESLSKKDLMSEIVNQ